MSSKGIDVSKNNGTVDWSKLANINFAYMKATEGVGYIDPKLSENASGASAAGIKIGYYHFATLNVTDVVKDATDEANCFLNAIKDLPANDMPLVLDIEKNAIGISQNGVLAFINAFVQVLKDAGQECVIYSYASFLNENLPVAHGLGSMKLWLAAYIKGDTPILPHGWTSYWMWQNSSTGHENGIATAVDEDIQ